MMKTLLLSLFLLIFSVPAQALDFNPGNYEVTSTMEMPGMPVAIPPQIITQCITEQEPVPDQNTQEQKCRMVDKKESGNTLTWKMECEQDGQKIISNGEMSYHKNGFDGTIKTIMPAEMGGMTMTVKIVGKRLGNCP